MNDSQIYEKLMNYTMPEPNTGCWIWFGAACKLGYGRIRYMGAPRLAHRISYMLHRGQFDDSLCLCHRCDNPYCVNPDHLFLGTMKDNTQDMINKGRKNPSHGTNHRTAKLKDDDVFAIRHLLTNSNLSIRKIGRMFGVSHINIASIRDGKTWKQLKAKLDIQKTVNLN